MSDSELEAPAKEVPAAEPPPESRHDEDDRLRPEFVREVLERVEAGDPDGARELVEPLHPADIADLFELTPEQWQALGRFDRVLIDPPREGALAVAQALAAPSDAPPGRVVYVSCNPATLARDLAVLVHEGGWQVRAAGVVNMFPQTSHVESMAVLEPPGRMPDATLP